MVGDRIQIQQVLINLLLNAMDAVADVAVGRRTITTTVDSTEERVSITVRDHGHGITPEVLSKLFDSFYSTKREGMGIGLSISRTIVEAHGGRIWAESGKDDGAVFHVEFPAIKRPADQPRTEAAL
jgi:signal transduction histidine kinase